MRRWHYQLYLWKSPQRCKCSNNSQKTEQRELRCWVVVLLTHLASFVYLPYFRSDRYEQQGFSLPPPPFAFIPERIKDNSLAKLLAMHVYPSRRQWRGRWNSGGLGVYSNSPACLCLLNECYRKTTVRPHIDAMWIKLTISGFTWIHCNAFLPFRVKKYCNIELF